MGALHRHRHATKGRHRIDDVTPASLLHHRPHLFNRIHHPGGGLTVHHRYIGDGGIFIQRLANLLQIWRQLLAVIEIDEIDAKAMG